MSQLFERDRDIKRKRAISIRIKYTPDNGLCKLFFEKFSENAINGVIASPVVLLCVSVLFGSVGYLQRYMFAIVRQVKLTSI